MRFFNIGLLSIIAFSIVYTHGNAGSYEDMKLLIESTSSSAVKIKSFPENKVATGILLGIPQNINKLALITNKHVIDKARSLELVIQLVDNNSVVVDTSITRVNLYSDTAYKDSLFYCPKDGLDLAVVIINKREINNKGKRLTIIAYSLFVNQRDILPGMPVNFVGFPMGLAINGWKPFIRSGSIAGFDTLKSEIYLDAQVFGGSSGSPVFIDLRGGPEMDFVRSKSTFFWALFPATCHLRNFWQMLKINR